MRSSSPLPGFSSPAPPGATILPIVHRLGMVAQIIVKLKDASIDPAKPVDRTAMPAEKAVALPDRDAVERPTQRKGGTPGCRYGLTADGEADGHGRSAPGRFAPGDATVGPMNGGKRRERK